MAVHLLCAGVLAVAIAALLGHLYTRPDWYKWSPSDPGLTIGTLLCFAALTIAILLLSILSGGDRAAPQVIIGQTGESGAPGVIGERGPRGEKGDAAP